MQKKLKVTNFDPGRVVILNRPVLDSGDSDPRSAPGAPAPGWRHGLRLVQWICLMLVLAGCTTVGPDFVQPEAPVLEQWQEADGAVLTRTPAEQIRWWEAFGDPVLSKLIEIAYQNNYSLKIAGLRVLEARAQLGIAVGYLYPQVQQANGGANYTSASKNAANTQAGDLEFWEYNVGASVAWELDFWGKFRRAIESADANLLASIAAYDNALVLLVAQVADTYVAIRTAEAQLRVARENVALQQRGRSDHRGPVPRRRCRRARRAPGAHPAAGDPGDDPAVGDRAAAGKERPQYPAGPAPGRPRGDSGPAAGRDSRRRRKRSPRAPRPTCSGGVPMCVRRNSPRRRKARRWVSPRPTSIRASD